MSTPTYQTPHTFNINPADATPMVRQFLEVKSQHTGVLLFYRMGDFYETFFEDALIAARVLDITLTGRDAGKLGRIPMAGIPVKAADNYLGKLLTKQFKVAICEQIGPSEENLKTTGGKTLMDRRVVRILSSGTLTEGLKPQENLYLAAVTLTKKLTPACGLAYCDLSTGQFWAGEMSQAQLMSELARIRPAELLVTGKIHRALPGEGVDELKPDMPADFTDAFACTPLNSTAFDLNRTEPLMKALLRVNTLDGLGLNESLQAKTAVGVIAHYLRQTFPDDLPVFEGITPLRPEAVMALNASARQNLELLRTTKTGDYTGSLLWVLDKTQTPMGARLLRQWLSQPLTHLPEIHSRLDGVEELVNCAGLRSTLQTVLSRVYDLERLAVRLANLNATPRDLIALRQSVAQLPDLAEALLSTQPACGSFHLLRAQVFPQELTQLADRIARALSDLPPLTLNEGGVIRDGYHAQLDQLRGLLTGQNDWLTRYEQSERERTGIRTLKVQNNGAFGYFIEITKANVAQAPPDYVRKQTLTNAERFTTEDLRRHEAEVNEAQSRILTLESSLYANLREALLPFAPALKDAAHRVAVLDVLLSFATVAAERQYCKPVVDDSLVLDLRESRHPVVEALLPMGQFVPNPCKLAGFPHPNPLPKGEGVLAQSSPSEPSPLGRGQDERITQKSELSFSATPPHLADSLTPTPSLREREHAEEATLLLITGPNMAGKSTYMRQVATIVLLAQIGSFVPASHAHIGLVDAIYTRVGAVDDLSGGQSTFMVEMVETAQILNGASVRSLVLLDEVGRGTSTYDGVSIAWSVAEHLVRQIGCRSLFATHYHELNTLAEVYPAVQNLRVCVSENETGIRFLHTVEPGTAQKSYGIQVARMAGVPAEVVRRASGILNDLQKNQLARIDIKRASKNAPKTGELPQLSLF